MNWQLAVAAVSLVAACDHGQLKTPLANEAPQSRLALARAYELGRGRPRDYRRAAQIYGELCANGCGDLEACRRYARLAVETRGVVLDGYETARLDGAMCDRGVMRACYSAAGVGFRDWSVRAAPAAVQAACAGGELDACQVGLSAQEIAAVEGWPVLPMQIEACELGDVLGCMAVLDDTCDFEDPALCFKTLQTSAATTSNAAGGRFLATKAARGRRAYAKLEAACDEGDADGCHMLPARRLDAHILCAAGDYAKCLEVEDAATLCTVGLGYQPACERTKATRGDVHEVMFALREHCAASDASACDSLRARLASSTCARGDTR